MDEEEETLDDAVSRPGVHGASGEASSVVATAPFPHNAAGRAAAAPVHLRTPILELDVGLAAAG